MARPWKFLSLALALALAVSPALAQEDAQDAEPSEEVQDVIVVTASRTEQKLHEVPTTVTVITAEELENAPVDDYGDILRNVPGLNVSQMSARDVQITGRAATSSLATNQLVLVDGRTLYLDFFGFVMWDFLPSNPREIKQIEVVRGPGSAVWGANAMTGVVNLITKKPREITGTSLQLGAGELGTSFGSVTHAGAGDKVSYKLSGGYYEQDAYDRPTGLIQGSPAPGTPYPDFQNQGTEQPKAEIRVDYDPTIGSSWTFSGGYAATDGIIHTGIGPFDIDSGSNMTYFKTGWTRQALQVNFFANLLDGEAANQLTRDAFGNPLLLGFESETYNLDASNTNVVGENHILTYGATARKNQFDLTIAPDGRQPGRDRSLPAGRDPDRRPRALADRCPLGRPGSHRLRGLPPHRAPGLAEPEPHLPGVVQPRLPRAVVDQQLPRHHDLQRRLPAPRRSGGPSGSVRHAAGLGLLGLPVGRTR